MKDYTLQERAEFYHKAFPKFPPLRADDRWLDGMWVLGNNYRGSGYYGSYPPAYLKRIMSLFPDAEHVLHLFSGSIARDNLPVRNIRVDIQGDADVKADAHELSKVFYQDKFDLILADPPYSVEDSEHYGTPMIKCNVVVKECATVLRPGGFLVWLDQVLPMFRKDILHLCGLIGIVRSTNHRFRVVSIFRRV